jgi:hypothetical protein
MPVALRAGRESPSPAHRPPNRRVPRQDGCPGTDRG